MSREDPFRGLPSSDETNGLQKRLPRPYVAGYVAAAFVIAGIAILIMLVAIGLAQAA